MNWETGYGDWIAEPIWDQLRVLPWLPGTAMVLADAVDEETGQEIPDRAADDPQAQVARALDAGYVLKAAPSSSSTCSRIRGNDLAERGWPVPRPFGHYNEDYHLLQATKAEPLHRLLRNQMTAATCRSSSARARRQRPARGQHPLRPRPRVGRPQRRLQARRQGDRLPQRLGHHLHGQAGPPLDRLSGHLHMSLWDKAGRCR
jgi:glutamine synthetase